MIFLDFEASAGMGGYPIEVGYCVVGPDRALRSAAKLIRHDDWLDEFPRWDWRAEQIHHISRANIMELGEPPAVVMTWLNKELAGMVVVADSPMDEIWMRELVEIAGIPSGFRLIGDIRAAFDGPEVGQEAKEEDVDRVARKTHHAADDAEHLAVKYVMSLREGAQVHRLYRGDTGNIERRPLEQDDAICHDGLICPGCRQAYINPRAANREPYCGWCRVALRPTTWGEMRALPVGITVSEAPTR
ncbi:MAG: hypothetical protein EPN20_15725 [Magnetospirillum sp.]|nr:MAG: hypothetical protein EPN20_15725 [Magnetospirillum sp.]